MQADILNISDISTAILQVLNEAQILLSSRQIASRVRELGFNLSEYQIIAHLRKLNQEGYVTFQGQKWLANIKHRPKNKKYLSRIDFPKLSDETQRILHQVEPASDKITNGPQKVKNYRTGNANWEVFRGLLDYYRQCIRNEEGAEAFAYQNQFGERFLYQRKVGAWYPRPHAAWQTIIPLGEYMSAFINNLPGPTDEDALIVGYPVFAFCKVRNQEPDVAFIRPIFYFPVEYSIGHSGLLLRNIDPAFAVNLNWLEYAFKKSPEKRQSFLSACGFSNTSYTFAEISAKSMDHAAPTLNVLVNALKSFMPQKIKEQLTINAIPDELLSEPFDTGIYNRAVVMIARRSRYSASLLKELTCIKRATDAELETTALKFLINSKERTNELKKSIHEEKVIDVTALNAEQRNAVASLLENPLTVVTGPPGTGKSQVIAAASLNIRLYDQTLLFASRNHKAIDAVYNRLFDNVGRPLMVRTNSKEDPSLKFTFIRAIKQLLNDQFNGNAVQKFRVLLDEILYLLERRGIFAKKARMITETSTALGRLEEQMSYLARKLPPGMSDFLQVKPAVFPLKAITRITQILKRLALKPAGESLDDRIFSWLTCMLLLPFYVHTRRIIEFIPSSPQLPKWPTPTSLTAAFNDFMMLEMAGRFVQLRFECISFENKLREMPELEEMVGEIRDITDRIVSLSSRLVNKDWESRTGLPYNADRQELAELINTFRIIRRENKSGQIRDHDISGLQHVMHAFPCWAVTNLSAGSRIPLIPGLFDLLVIDEASQSDIPSTIPLLFRAKRVGVVGDPHQLRFCSKISPSKDIFLRNDTGIKDRIEARFFYAENSIYDLCSSTRGAKTIFLSETYRSVKEIAEYSNVAFYNGRLRVATEATSLKVPKGSKAGINWTNIEGAIQSGGGSGCYCKEEINAVRTAVRNLLLDNYKGTLGIVTPFRQQANRIRDALFESDATLYQFLVVSKCNVDTAHGFQGDERDVIIFSLCGGPDMPRGSLSFLKDSANLFNVAASRARAVLHIIGNRGWAEQSNIPHIKKLSRPAPAMSAGKVVLRSPWHPHESPWEKIFYDALVAEGMDPRPQFPVAGRRLDMALIKTGTSLKIDIEVDGDCHRNPDGTRKIDDVWRDIQLQGRGWQIMRFWTYQLREDLHGCVRKIHTIWSQY